MIQLLVLDKFSVIIKGTLSSESEKRGFFSNIPAVTRPQHGIELVQHPATSFLPFNMERIWSWKICLIKFPEVLFVPAKDTFIHFIQTKRIRSKLYAWFVICTKMDTFYLVFKVFLCNPILAKKIHKSCKYLKFKILRKIQFKKKRYFENLTLIKHFNISTVRLEMLTSFC